MKGRGLRGLLSLMVTHAEVVLCPLPVLMLVATCVKKRCHVWRATYVDPILTHKILTVLVNQRGCG